MQLRNDPNLNQLNTTAYKSVIGQYVLIGTSFVVAFAFIAEILGPGEAKKVALSILDSWLFFLAAVLGIGAAQYGIKRATDSGLAEARSKGQETARMQQAVETKEHDAVKPVPAVQVNAEDQSHVEVKSVAPAPPGEEAAPAPGRAIEP